MNLFIAAPLCALVVAITNNIGVFTGDVNFVQTYMSGFSGFIASWFFMFLLGALFGKFMEDTGAADAVSRWIITKIGYKRAVLAVVLACAILTYGGVSVFVVAFSVYPMAVSLFKDANLPPSLHTCCHGIRVGNIYDDLRGLARNPKLDPYKVFGHLPFCRVGS